MNALELEGSVKSEFSKWSTYQERKKKKNPRTDEHKRTASSHFCVRCSVRLSRLGGMLSLLMLKEVILRMSAGFQRTSKHVCLLRKY